ncbi:hypothetical protein BRC90_03800 [Halobacteriales archaeon QS_4_69_34]|nr:MAG: hypothetical protein BRC90_03800 [Halobacteriales archaeon QS_4_69_34]
MGGKDTETCGRCAMSSVTGLATDGQSAEEHAERDPFGGSRIELPAGELRTVSPGAWLAGAKRRLDEVATRLTYGP